MRTRLMAGVGLAAAAAMTLTACGGGGGTDSGNSGGSNSSEMSSSMSSSSSAPMSSSSKASMAGMTTAEDVYGPACGKVPKSGPGSVSAMKSVPVATAASNNPLLDKLTKAVKAANLADTLNNAKGITVFAPYDKAFKALGSEKFKQLASKPDKLASILKFHVVPQRYSAKGLAEAGMVKTLNKDAGELKIEGKGQDITINGNKVLCGNIPTANATVFVIDKVMTPSMK